MSRGWYSYLCSQFIKFTNIQGSMDYMRCLELCKQILLEGICIKQDGNDIKQDLNGIDDGFIDNSNVKSIYKWLCKDVLSTLSAGRIIALILYAEKLVKQLTITNPTDVLYCNVEQLLSILALRLVICDCKVTTLSYIIELNRIERKRLSFAHYQKFFDGIADDLTLDNVKIVKYILKDSLPHWQEINTSRQLLRAMQVESIIKIDDIDELEYICELLPRKDLIPKIKEYKQTICK